MSDCDYCKRRKIIFDSEFIDKANWGWGYDDVISLTLNQAESDPVTKSSFIDRGFLRFVELTESNCLDHGIKIEIKFCPFCGCELQKITNPRA